jgi:hypothetical protein
MFELTVLLPRVKMKIRLSVSLMTPSQMINKKGRYSLIIDLNRIIPIIAAMRIE